MQKRTTFSGTMGDVKVRTTLFGQVDNDRWDREHVEQRRRLEQLQPYKKPEMELFVDGKGNAYPVIDGKIRWNYWEKRDDD